MLHVPVLLKCWITLVKLHIFLMSFKEVFNTLLLTLAVSYLIPVFGTFVIDSDIVLHSVQFISKLD